MQGQFEMKFDNKQDRYNFLMLNMKEMGYYGCEFCDRDIPVLTKCGGCSKKTCFFCCGNNNSGPPFKCKECLLK